MKTIRIAALISLLTVALPLTLAAQAPKHVSCTAVDESQPAPNPAVALYWSGDSKAAADKFKELLAAQPADPVLTEFSVRANIGLGDVATAAAQAQAALAAHPDSAAANTAQGEVLFRQGRISDSDHLFAKATQLDPCYAPARLGLARNGSASSMYASERDALRVAHALDARDPDIRFWWISTLPLPQRLDELKKLQKSVTSGTPRAEQVDYFIDAVGQRIENQGQHPCELVSAVDKTDISMSPILEDITHIASYGLDTFINGQSARLLLDSGASGIVIGKGFAAKSGLKLVEKSSLWGFGDHGEQKAYVAYANTIKVGNLEFHDCRVDVSDRRDVVDVAGLIGPDVFRHYLVSINYPDHKLTLSQLPPRPGNGPAEGSNLDTDAESGNTNGGAQDRYIAPEMKDFTPVYRFGHMLLVPTLVNDVPEGLMVLDTGDCCMSISYDAAKKVTHARIDNLDSMHGLSGKVEKLSMGGDVTFKFGHAGVKVDDISVMDHSHMSESIGTEISGFIGYPALHAAIFQIDYRDGLVNFVYDHKKDPNRAPASVCTYCTPGYSPY